MLRRNKSRSMHEVLNSKSYRKFRFILYFIVLLIMIFIYFVSIMLFDSFWSVILIVFFSVILYLFVKYREDELLKVIEDYHLKKRVSLAKKSNKDGLKSTLNMFKSKEKRKVHFKVSGKEALKHKVQGVKDKVLGKSKKKEEKGYIEIED